MAAVVSTFGSSFIYSIGKVTPHRYIILMRICMIQICKCQRENKYTYLTTKNKTILFNIKV